MLLETLDVKKNDVVIFSQNIFDLEENFKIIYKDDLSKEIRPINYEGVCHFISELTPKNLIVYRLLTNIKNFELYHSKYGYNLSINDKTELIFFDPVFAVKELEDYNEAINYYDLRFRIQQVGLTMLNRLGSTINYAEIYSIDLEASEAQNQNDKAFAEAIFFSKEKNKKSEVKKIEKKEPAVITRKNFGERIIDLKDKGNRKRTTSIISEDKNFDYKQVKKINLKAKTQPQEEKKNSSSKEIPRILTTEKNNESAFSEFLRNKKKETSENVKQAVTKETKADSRLINIFKSSTSLKRNLKEKENRHFVLKLNKK